MSKFITSYEISFHIEDVFKGAKQGIYILSPYLKLTENMYKNFVQANERGINITIVYGKTELSSQLQSKLVKLQNLNLLFVPNLHAKCYFNEEKVIITSMNLHEYSEKNNFEMGMLIERTEAYDLYWDILNEARYIIEQGKYKIKSKVKSIFYIKEKLDLFYERLREEFPNQKIELVKENNSNMKFIFAENFFINNIDLRFDENISLYLGYSRKLNQRIITYLEKYPINDCRMYFNDGDKISIYYSLKHRDKWHTYDLDFKSDYYISLIKNVIKAIKRGMKEMNIVG